MSDPSTDVALKRGRFLFFGCIGRFRTLGLWIILYVEWLGFDSSTIRAHMSAAAAPKSAGGQEAQSLGKSRGGFTSKVHIKTDALGNPLKVVLTVGQRHDVIGYRMLREEEDLQSHVV